MNENNKNKRVKKTDKVDLTGLMMMTIAVGAIAGFQGYLVEMSISISAGVILCALKTGFDAIIKTINEKQARTSRHRHRF